MVHVLWEVQSYMLTLTMNEFEGLMAVTQHSWCIYYNGLTPVHSRQCADRGKILQHNKGVYEKHSQHHPKQRLKQTSRSKK